MLQGIIPFAHQLLKESVDKGSVTVDATSGNGNDTLFLSELVGESGKVYAFDIQQQAIETTKALLKEKKCHNVNLIHDSHSNVKQYLPDNTEISGAIFNLGYLPRSNKQIITKADTTIQSIEALLEMSKKGARIVVVVYHGHEGGKEEKDAVIQFARELDQKNYGVIQYQFINHKNNPPFVVAIEKR